MCLPHITGKFCDKSSSRNIGVYYIFTTKSCVVKALPIKPKLSFFNSLYIQGNIKFAALLP